MIHEVRIPQEDLNSEFAVIEKWNVDTWGYVKKGDIICGIETTKAAFEIESPATGYIRLLKDEGHESTFTEAIAVIGDSEEEIRGYEEVVPETEDIQYNVTRKARVLIEQHKVDITKIPALAEDIITERDVKEYLKNRGDVEESGPSSPGVLPAGMKRVGLIGAGLGLTQVWDILKSYHDVNIAQIYDDDESTWGEKKVYGLQVRGGIDRCLEDFERGEITHAVITISTSISARTMLAEKAASKGLPLLSAIDKSCQIKSDVVIGAGNVICSNVHIGTGTVIGNNNFISACNSFDHHNAIGSHITTGPGVMTSGLVVIEDEVKFGTGVFVEPHIRIGRRSIIASGSIVTKNIPPLHIMKSFIKSKIEEI